MHNTREILPTQRFTAGLKEVVAVNVLAACRVEYRCSYDGYCGRGCWLATKTCSRHLPQDQTCLWAQQETTVPSPLLLVWPWGQGQGCVEVMVQPLGPS